MGSVGILEKLLKLSLLLLTLTTLASSMELSHMDDDEKSPLASSRYPTRQQ
jgi:hypothetical protein